MIAVEFHGVTKQYGRRQVLKDVNLTIESNTFSIVLGAPASGKSVLVRLLAGLEKPTSGRITLRGSDVTPITPGDRNIGYVPQSFALYPHFKVFDNIAYPLKLMSVRKSDIAPLVHQTAELLQISHLLEKRPEQLSGGEKQRVAIARGIIKNTEIFVMDDPLIGLDFKLREQLFDDLKQLQENLQATVIYTTSDPLEALMLAQQISILDGGRIIESGSLEDVYKHPQNLNSLTLLGFPPANVFPGHLSLDKLSCQTGLFDFPINLNGVKESPEKIMVGIRPQDIHLDTNQGEGWLTRQAQIVLVEDLGGEQVVYLEADGLPLVVVVRHTEAHLISSEYTTIAIKPESLVIYSADTGQRLGQGHG
ncbi:MAG: ABC transporter ATP-binding protein [Anaerolineae bacterium]|nr:ABC transporter ATP-binding protein [Anaerolineae bacterium]